MLYQDNSARSDILHFQRDHLPARKTFFDDLRALTRYLYLDSGDHLLTFMLQGLELEIPPNTS